MGMGTQRLKPKKSSVVLFVGPPLVGKDEMVKHLSDVMTRDDVKGTVRHVSLESVLRWSPDLLVQKCLGEYLPVPQEIVTAIMAGEINMSIGSGVYLTAINGYPRTLEQAENLIAMLQEHKILYPVCVHMAGTYDLLTKRLQKHLSSKKNAVAVFDEVMSRWDEYRVACETMIPYLRKRTRFVEVNPEPPEERKQKPISVFAEMWALMGHHVTELSYSA